MSPAYALVLLLVASVTARPFLRSTWGEHRNHLLQAIREKAALISQPAKEVADPLAADLMTDSEDNLLYSGKITLAEATMKVIPNPTWAGTILLTENKTARLKQEAEENRKIDEDLLTESNSTLFNYTVDQPISQPLPVQPEQLANTSKTVVTPYSYYIPELKYQEAPMAW
mmetsp:Transcript_138203/g.240466  ORF Transcript_138203/g.240466 Transcript_138203/m.240466 type:complete len:171 (-) Transcript_138203:96-608(-)